MPFFLKRVLLLLFVLPGKRDCLFRYHYISQPTSVPGDHVYYDHVLFLGGLLSCFLYSVAGGGSEEYGIRVGRVLFSAGHYLCNPFYTIQGPSFVDQQNTDINQIGPKSMIILITQLLSLVPFRCKKRNQRT